MTAPDRVRLPFGFDPAPIRSEVDALPAEAWEPHFNTQQYEGDWSGVALRVAVGSPLALYPDPGATEHAGTAWLDRCPATASLLARVPDPLLTARFLRLGPGARILRHRDHALRVADGEARLHLPVSGTEGVEFLLDDVAVPMAPGECWYLDLTRPHAARNDGDRARVHLVVDVAAGPWLAEHVGVAGSDRRAVLPEGG